MSESKTGTEKFIIIDRLVFLSAVLLTVVIATATTTHPYDKKSYLENPADLLSFESLLESSPEVPVAGDIEKEQKEAPKAEVEKQPEKEQAKEPVEETTVPASHNHSTTSVQQTTKKPQSTQTQSRKSNIDWSIVHVDDNGEYFDNDEPAMPIIPSTPEQQQPANPQPEQPQEQPQSSSTQPQPDEQELAEPKKTPEKTSE